MKKIILFLGMFLCAVLMFADNNFTAGNYVFQSVKAGQNIILTNKNGEKVGMLRVMSPQLIICYDNQNRKIGMIAHQGNIAVLFDNDGNRLGVIEKIGPNYVLNKELDSNKENKDMIHVNNQRFEI